MPRKFEEIRVPCEKLQTFQLRHFSELKNRVVTLVIDVQGAELEVLKSANLQLVDQIVVECSKRPFYSKTSGSHIDVVSYLQTLGFRHNLDLADISLGHGDQFFSKKIQRKFILKRIFWLIQEEIYVHPFSLFNRLRIAVLIRLRTFQNSN